MNEYLPNTVVPTAPVLIGAAIIVLAIIWLFFIQPMIAGKKRNPDPGSSPVHRIFLSYRRVDSADVTGRLFDRLQERYGSAVFKDVDSIPVGVDFRTHVGNALDSTDVFLAIIGPSWIEQLNRDAPDSDFVYVETRVALSGKIPIVPVLVRGADMPEASEMPNDLEELAFINATKLRSDPDFNADVQKLIESIDTHLS